MIIILFKGFETYYKIKGIELVVLYTIPKCHIFFDWRNLELSFLSHTGLKRVMPQRFRIYSDPMPHNM